MSIRFPAFFGPESDGAFGKAPKNPLTMYLEMDFQDDAGDGLVLSFSLEDALDLNEVRENTDQGDDSYHEGLSAIRDGLRKLADKIDSAMKPVSVRLAG